MNRKLQYFFILACTKVKFLYPVCLAIDSSRLQFLKHREKRMANGILAFFNFMESEIHASVTEKKTRVYIAFRMFSFF